MRFRLGINYWPARKAMYWWRRFDLEEVRSDFRRISQAGFDSVRIFLLWEDFQPSPGEVSQSALSNLVQVADTAAKNGLSLIATLFTGHMSGVNWLPSWALLDVTAIGRFRVVSDGCVVNRVPRNWYTDEAIREAQTLLARSIADALGKHPALWAYDLGNENSNCVVPPSRESGIAWLQAIAGAIRAVDANHPITLGLHAEDLEEDRHLGPQEAVKVCNFLSMHGYPIYLSWALAANDEGVLPFLGLITRWLGGECEVLFEEFGAPTIPAGQAAWPARDRLVALDQLSAACFTERALQALHQSGHVGAMLWCFADYDASLWSQPPLDHAPHERHFGLWTSDYSGKPALDRIKPFVRRSRQPWPQHRLWIDMYPHDFYQQPLANLRRLYGNFCECYPTEKVRTSA